MDEGPDLTTGVAGIAIRLLAPGDENVVRELAKYDGPGDPEALLADPRTLLLAAFDEERPVGFVLAHERGIRTGFVLTEPDNGPANALYRGAGGATDLVKVEWTFSYEDD